MSDTDSPGPSGNPKPSISESMINQITADLDKKEREAAKAQMAKIIGEIRAAEKLIRVKNAELQKIKEDIEAGIFTS
jgi:hypothetical protein